MSFASLFAGSDHRPSPDVRIGGELVEGRIYVPILSEHETRIADQIRLAATLSDAIDGELLIEDPAAERDPFGSDLPDDADDTVDVVRDYFEDRPPGERGVLAGRKLERQVLHRTGIGDVAAMVVPGDVPDDGVSTRRVERIASRSACNVVTVNGQGGYRSFASLLLAIANGPHSGVATDVAASIASVEGTWVDVLHVIPPNLDPDLRAAAQERVDRAAGRIDRPESVTPWLLEAEDPAGTIVEQSAYYGLTVIGAPRVGRLKRLVYGSISRRIRDRADSVVIAARTARN